MNHRTRIGLMLGWVAMLAACNDNDTPAKRLQSYCGASSWIAGVTELCRGHLVYRDYVYDDYGADRNQRTAPIPDGTLSRSAGDDRYPAGAENTADLVRLELWLEGQDVVVEFELNTLYAPDQTVAVLAMDSDALDAALPDRPVTTLDHPQWEIVQVFSAGDPDTNLIKGRFPRPPGRQWTLWAYTAQADGTPMNVAFRGTQEEAGSNATPEGLLPTKGNFWEDKQAVALKNGDISGFAVTVAVADLERRVTRGSEIPPGLHQAVYTSRYTLPPGEGISLNGVPGRHGDTGSTCEQYFNFLGKYQPYGIYLPDHPGPHGLQLVMHGCAASHSSLINQQGMQQRFGEELNRILVVPLGRGPVGWYSDISERDVLDVVDDVLAQHDVDREQVFSGGYSMGGYGALRMAALYPQRFAGVVNWVGFTGDNSNNPAGLPTQDFVAGAVGNVIDFVRNLRHVPSVSLYSGADELVWTHTALALQRRFLQDSEALHEFYFHPNAEHLTYAVLDDWRKEAQDSTGWQRVQNPAQISYRHDPALANADYGLRHDRAYWVHDLAGREAGYVDVEIKSLGCGPVAPVFVTGSDGGVGPAALAWTRQFRRVAEETPVVAANRLEATLVNVASFRIDAAAACLRPGRLAYKVQTDGAVDIRLSDGRRLQLDAAGEHEGVL